MNRREFGQRLFYWSLGAGLAGALGCREPRSEPTDYRRPNILFCVADDVSYPHMGAYGCSWVKTPAFDRVAANGVLFSRAYTPNAKCAPSRACLLTGRNSWQLETAANHMPFWPDGYVTYPEVLAEAGYHVGYTGKGWRPGIAEDADGQPRHLCGKPYQRQTLVPPSSGIHKCDYSGNFDLFLADRRPGQPFCFWYGSMEPHRRYEYGAGVKKGGKRLEEIDRIYGFWPDNERVRTDMLDYAYELEHFDAHLQKMLDRLEEIGELENTLVVVTADNGMPFPRIKGQAYEPSNHMPLAMMWLGGGGRRGRKIDDYVSFIDLAPTFLSLAQAPVENCGMKPITGKSLVNILCSNKTGTTDPSRDFVLIGKERHDVGRPEDDGYPIRGIIKDDWLYVVNFETDRWPIGNPETGYLNCDGSPTKTVCLDAKDDPQTRDYWRWSFGKRPSEELYNIRQDADCVVNLADNSRFQAVRDRLRKKLFMELKAQNDPRMFGRGHVFDDYDVCFPQFRNFYERHQAGEKPSASWVNDSDSRPGHVRP